jgi:hypothetical protein
MELERSGEGVGTGGCGEEGKDGVSWRCMIENGRSGASSLQSCFSHPSKTPSQLRHRIEFFTPLRRIVSLTAPSLPLSLDLRSDRSRLSSELERSGEGVGTGGCREGKDKVGRRCMIGDGSGDRIRSGVFSAWILFLPSIKDSSNPHPNPDFELTVFRRIHLSLPLPLDLDVCGCCVGARECDHEGDGAISGLP